MDVNKKRNIVALLTLLFLAFFLPFSLSIIINQEKVTSQQSVAKLPPFSFSDTFALTGQGNEVAIARTRTDIKDTAPPTLVAAQEALENKYPASFLSARNTNATSKKLVAAESVTDTSTESLGEIFEGWSATGPLDAYAKYSTSSFTREKDGTGSQMITAEQKGVGISRHFTGLDPTKTYQAEAWIYVERGGVQVGINDQITPTKSTAEWVNLTSQPFTKVSDINLYLTTSGDNSVFFVDGVTVGETTTGAGEGQEPSVIINRTLSGPHFRACYNMNINQQHPPVYSYVFIIQEYNQNLGAWTNFGSVEKLWWSVAADPNGSWSLTRDFDTNKTYRARFVLKGSNESGNSTYVLQQEPSRTEDWLTVTFPTVSGEDGICFNYDNGDNFCNTQNNIWFNFEYCAPTPTQVPSPTPTPHIITFSGQFKCNGININDPSNSARLSGEMHIENYDQQRHYYQATGSNSFTGPFTLDYWKINLQPKSLYFVLKKDGQVLDQSGVSTNWGILETAQPWIGFSMPNGPVCTGPGCNPHINNIVIDFPYCDNVCTRGAMGPDGIESCPTNTPTPTTQPGAPTPTRSPTPRPNTPTPIPPTPTTAPVNINCVQHYGHTSSCTGQNQCQGFGTYWRFADPSNHYCSEWAVGDGCCYCADENGNIIDNICDWRCDPGRPECQAPPDPVTSTPVPPTHTPTRTPTPVCNRVTITNFTAGPMNQLPSPAIASSQNVSFTYQRTLGTATPQRLSLSIMYDGTQTSGPATNWLNPVNGSYTYVQNNTWLSQSTNNTLNKYKLDIVWPTGTFVCADSPSFVYSNTVTTPLYNPHGTARVQALNTTPTPYPASCRLFGWTRDQDADKRAPQGVPVSVHVYKNGTYNGGGQFLTSTTANIVRSDLPFGTGFQNHGYDINFYTALTPTALAELTGSTTIPLYVYAINSTGTAGGNTVISPLTTSGVSTLSIRCTPNGPTLTPTRTPTPTVSTCPPITNFSAGYTACNPDHTAQARFTWTPITSAVYTLQVSTNSTFTSPYPFPTFTVQPFLSNISSPATPRWYRMKVQSAPGCTVPGNWSPIVGPISRLGC